MLANKILNFNNQCKTVKCYVYSITSYTPIVHQNDYLLYQGDLPSQRV